MQTKIVEGGLNCSRFGEITAIDCTCLRDKACNDCWIYKSLAPPKMAETKVEVPLDLIMKCAQPNYQSSGLYSLH